MIYKHIENKLLAEAYSKIVKEGKLKSDLEIVDEEEEFEDDNGLQPEQDFNSPEYIQSQFYKLKAELEEIQKFLDQVDMMERKQRDVTEMYNVFFRKMKQLGLLAKRANKPAPPLTDDGYDSYESYQGDSHGWR